MIYAAVQVVFYALAAAASFLVLTATFLVVRSARPRTNGIAFLSGFVFGTVVACGIGLAVGQAVVTRFDSHETFKAVITVALGLALLAVGVQARRTGATPPEARSSRAAAILDGLSHVGPAASSSMAGLLGFGGPKRLLLTFIAMAAVTDAGLRDVVDAGLVVVYIAVSTALVSVPIGIVVVAGDRAAAILARGQSWVSAHGARLRTWLSFLLGGALLADGLLRLLL
ncbi:GAP family protein [Nocardioides sp. GCM10028917]|uniref:GAP family protein n=1 Tax=Nocardioides sp. GCM10028917 TaxID=3273408 RepID=UPI00360E3017